MLKHEINIGTSTKKIPTRQFVEINANFKSLQLAFSDFP